MALVNFKPGSELTFQSVVSIRSKLIEALSSDNLGTFCMDLTDVVLCDSAGLALLLEARKLCKQKNKMFEVKGISAETQSLAEFCGVKNILETA